MAGNDVQMQLAEVEENYPLAYASLMQQIAGKEQETLLDKLAKMKSQSQATDARAAAAAQMVGSPGGVQYYRRPLGGEIPGLISTAAQVAKLAGAAGG